MSNSKVITYSPLTGSFYKGDQSNVNMNHAQSYLKPIATLKANAIKDANFQKGYASNRRSLIANSTLVSQSQGLANIAQQHASGTLTAAADPENLSNLQQIQLIRRVIGDPEYYFGLDEAFETVNVPMLQARESIQGTTSVGDYQDPLEETEFNEAKFDEFSYNLKKIPVKIYTPIEDIMRTVINPQDINIRTSAQALAKKRNDYARAALETITDNSNISAISALAAGGFHNTNRTASEIAEVINTHLKADEVKYTHIVMNTTDFAKYTENTWTNTGPTNMQFNRPIGAAYGPFPGVDGLTAVIDTSVADNTGYLIDKLNGARLAEGPKIERRYYDEERDAEAIKILDFNQYLIVKPDSAKVNRSFSTKLTFATT